MKAGFYQFAPRFGDMKYNLQKVIDAAAPVETDLLVLPELFNTGYQFTSKEEAKSLSEKIPSGDTANTLIKLSAKKKVYIAAGIAEYSEGKIYNSAVLTGPDGLIGVYRKIHLFYEEKLWFSPGDTGFKVWQTPLGNIGIMICFDWFFPESARTLAFRGADVIAHPSNLILPHCPDAMVTRCIENKVFTVTANRTGSEQRGDKEKLMFIGKSQITSPKGEILYRASGDREELTVIEIAVEKARDKNLNSMNNLFSDRKKEFYE
ncbi:MAG: acyltransferase [Nitrospirae bacterium GWF2_44_13]|nr:MAG: acyltransferase [Nitrospirae bacterium GWF2_44_13]OGW64359.1 MAG: acyltransferase [Nitrospirae bacterium RIFOXYA2_FULL_44_9]OGW71086.1 MAG: acyltransferase [Nitrospirae bacterium RIFOXYC2_FULL_44_7]HBG93289.1 acyltransferase [Nitrospiraceae bacterium]HBU05761.1 acyltransferase [Nitrospiraceae bacterium]